MNGKERKLTHANTLSWITTDKLGRSCFPPHFLKQNILMMINHRCIILKRRTDLKYNERGSQMGAQLVKSYTYTMSFSCFYLTAAKN